MYRLYYAPGTASMVVHWLLIEMELPHQLELVDFSKKQQKSEEYLKLNPSGVIPTLVVEGKPITEFAAMSMFLADKHQEKRLAPAYDNPLRGEYNQWMFYFSNTVQPAFRMWFYPYDILSKEDGADEKILPVAQKRIEACFERINHHFSDGRQYVLGETISVADFVLTMLMRWSRNMPKTADSWPYLNAFAGRMKSKDSFKELYNREGLTDWT